MDNLYNFLDKNAYYSILVIILIIWTGIFSYTVNLNKKIKKLKKEKSK
jgi:CcmD family protein